MHPCQRQNVEHRVKQMSCQSLSVYTNEQSKQTDSIGDKRVSNAANESLTVKFATSPAIMSPGGTQPAAKPTAGAHRWAPSALYHMTQLG